LITPGTNTFAPTKTESFGVFDAHAVDNWTSVIMTCVWELGFVKFSATFVSVVTEKVGKST